MGKDVERPVTLWDGYLEKIWAEFQDNPTAYLRQPTISRCLHPGGQYWYSGYWHELMEYGGFKADIPKIADGDVGKPWGIEMFDGLSPATVGHMYQLHMIERYMGVSVARNEVQHVTEIGGGYGNTCRVARALGYTGEWTIVDFPIMLEIQRQYLRDNGIDDVGFDIEVFEPEKNQYPSILIATNSVNEMPMEDRLKLEEVYPHFDYLFFSHNAIFDGISNIKYFYNLVWRLERRGFRVDWRPDFCRQMRKINHWFVLADKK